MSQVLSCNCRAVLCLTLLLTVAGCGQRSDRPETGEVSGIVTLDGQPLPNARIVFAPEQGGQSSEAVSDDQGRYVLIYRGDERGAKVGMHKVHVSTFEEAYPDDDGKMIGGQKELVPPQYNENTQLSVEVQPGTNDVPLDLTS